MTGAAHPGGTAGRVDPERWGVSAGFHDVAGRWRQCPATTLDAILDSMGATPHDPPAPALVTVRTDHQLPPLGPGRIHLEGGGEVECGGGLLPPDLPPGYHELVRPDGPTVPLVVSPGRVPVPDSREWGFAAQLYATRSRRSWGIGDMGDLCELASWSKRLRAGFVMVNPLHAATPGERQQPSPYYPGSRCFMNPLYIEVESVPGVEGVEALASAGRDLNRVRLIDREKVWALKSQALEAAFDRFGGDPDFDGYCAERGWTLDMFAAFCALAERHAGSWRAWPGGCRHPSGTQVGAVAASPRARYHKWLQWLLDRQLAGAAAALGVVTDLAVGVDPNGPDSWMWQDAFAPAMSVGAPPDEFNTLGQDWALPPFDPWRLRSSGYAPWIEALRAGLAHGAGLRVDHVMGLFRLFWIPEGTGAAEGAYVRYPHHDMLNIMALEADRAGAWVVGEDLGTVEDEVRRDLGERRVLSYRVWWFEKEPPPTWPHAAMAAVTTHDLPTVAGVFTGSDLEAQHRAGMDPNEDASAALRTRIEQRTGAAATTPLPDVVAAVYRDLSHAPCTLLAASLDDALEVEERPNMPGTTDAWPNWSIALPAPLERIEEALLPKRIAEQLARRASPGS